MYPGLQRLAGLIDCKSCTCSERPVDGHLAFPQSMAWSGKLYSAENMLSNCKPFDPAVPLLGLYPRDHKKGKRTYMCKNVASLFVVVAKNWKGDVHQLGNV